MKTPKDINKEISARLKGTLAEKRIRQKTIAEDLNISEQTVNAKMNGVTAFTCGEFAIIAAKYNFSVKEVIDIISFFYCKNVN